MAASKESPPTDTKEDVATRILRRFGRPVTGENWIRFEWMERRGPGPPSLRGCVVFLFAGTFLRVRVRFLHGPSEVNAGGIARDDDEIKFFTHVDALPRPDMTVVTSAGTRRDLRFRPVQDRVVL
jgi:hypothetical protein